MLPCRIKIFSFLFVITCKFYSGQTGWKLVENTKNRFQKIAWYIFEQILRIILFSAWGINGDIRQWRSNCRQYFVWRSQKNCRRCLFLCVFPLRKIAPRLGLGFGLGSEVELGLGAIFEPFLEA